MHQSDELVLLPATELRRLLGKGELSPVDVVEAGLAQIEKYNGAINAVCTVSERALDEARLAEQKAARREELGLLHGLPVGIKDVTPTAGLRTTYGSTLYAEHIPAEDALIVQRLKEAGAIIIGKTNTPEFAAGGNTFNDVFGPTRNPWNPGLSAGGSTGGGAAALATGMIALAEGTDLGGSMRIPASFCGVVGLRPSPGLVPTYPNEYAWDNLNVTGCMARTAEDVALILQAVSGPSPLSPLSQPMAGRDFVNTVQAGTARGIRLAYCADIAGIGIDEEIELTCRKAAFDMRQVGASVEEIELDLSFGRKSFLDIRGFWMVAQHYSRLDKLNQFGSNLKGNIEAGLKVTMKDLANAERARTKIWQIFCDFHQNYDHLLTPCMAVSPFPVEHHYPETIAGKKMKTYVDWFASTFLLSLTGLPVSSVPCGLTKGKLPVGLQIVGRPMGEESVLALSKQIQDANPIGLPSLKKLNGSKSIS